MSRDGQDDFDGLEFIPTFLKVKQIVLLRYNDFLDLLNEFNTTLKTFTNDEDYFLQFSIVPGTDKTVLWKALIRIKCTRILKVDDSIQNESVLNLHQFLSVHQSLLQQISTLQKCLTPLTNSTANPVQSLYNTSPTTSISSTKLSVQLPDANECCICMDRTANLLLPCTHQYCEECFQQWSTQSSSSHTCPLCRIETQADSGFILTEKPKYDNVKKMLTESILSLPDDYNH
ncbi:unnamed protein product [Didymodactylos carnosus]|uniref:RING-type domain-containing protein n=1 Tax=Didymodactylos carnosus TaxID=1234261 RepID=A0A813P6Y2_9BILA|nr:unnamed protein product [Didymodactylos carnosus]CAF0767734.1 unnamed protein product [Didymodactylos carnosus]CAF3524683.1 unnamed protein product [Didymodactylos carnosus]CAF3548239.1 unnamed protein product [Didymodactylos carnosus]